MPERWQDELKKLRREEMTDGVRERAEAGPRRDLPDDGRQRLVAGAVAFAVFIAAGAFAWRAFEGGDDADPAVDRTEAVVVDLAADPFAATLTYGGVTQDGVVNGSRWDTPEGTETGTGPYAIDFGSFVRIPAGTPIVIRSDAADVSVALEDPGNTPGPARTVALDAGTGTLPAAQGQYEMHVTGQWERGFATFAFGVQIVKEGTDAVVIALNGTTDGPTATLTSEGRTQEGARESYGWCNGDDCVGADADYATYPPVSEYLPAVSGSPFESAGDGELTRLVVRTTEGSFQSDNVVQDTDGTGAVVPTEQGRYVVWISAAWGDRGSATFSFGIEVLPPPEEAPDALHLTCTPDSAALDSSVVRAQADGVHIAIDASDDVNHAEVFHGSTPETFGGFGADERSDGSDGMSIAPGDWYIGCRRVGPSDVGSGAVAPFTVVDPAGHYVDSTLSCDDPSSLDLVGNGDGVVSATRHAIPGVLDTDGFLRAGYDGDQFKIGDLFVLRRDGSPIARVTLDYGAKTVWSFRVESCAGSGVGAEAESSSQAPAPDVAIVRCTADGTELDTPIVAVQPDGLHIDATNVARATDIFVAPNGSDGLIGTDAFDGADHREVVLPVPPGPATIACRTPEGGSITGGPDEYPDLFVPIEILDPSGLYVPSELACGRPDQEVIGREGYVFDLPAGEPYIRGSISGILPSDVVERAGYPALDGNLRFWRVVRDGEVLARITDPIMQGQACAGSGIGGA